MKLVIIFSAALFFLTMEACHVFKRNTPKPDVKSPDGVFAPGRAELTAIQATHKEVSMTTLREGYTLYTGVCTNCHKAKSIYSRPEDAWPGILTAMAKEANITAAQKDAIYKYVLAIKATQPK